MVKVAERSRIQDDTPYRCRASEVGNEDEVIRLQRTRGSGTGSVVSFPAGTEAGKLKTSQGMTKVQPPSHPE